MRVLLVHATRFTYKTVEEAISNPPDPPSTGSFENCLVAFVTVESGDGLIEVSRAASDIVVQGRRLGVNCIVVYPYAHLSPDLAPIDTAFKIIVSLEEKLREMWGGSVHRAPFGWYKAFELSCPGHPLAELSRSIRGGLEVTYKGLPLEEARARGLIDDWLMQRDPWSRDTMELVERLGLNSVEGRVTLWELEYELVKELGVARRVRVERPNVIYGIQGVAILSRICSESPGDGVELYWGDIGESLIVFRGDARRLLEELGVRVSDLLELELSSEGLDVGVKGYTLIYKARKGGGVPLAYNVGDRVCIGPLVSLAYAILDSKLKEADEGKTPQIHYKLAPIQVALIPVTEAHLDYAKAIASKLEEIRVRTRLLREGGLGARVREAGRLWVPLVAVVGDREVSTNTVSLRRRWEPGKQEVVTLEEFLEEVRRLNAGRLISKTV